MAETTADTPEEMVIKFRKAYGRLTEALAPVTAKTLRDTDKSYGRITGLLWQSVHSEAGLISRRLWRWAAIALFFILVSEVGQDVLNEWFPTDNDTDQTLLIVLQIIFMILGYVTPFLYGLLGACAYLLKSSHFFSIERSFDIHRAPEYNNRLLLGFIAGGAILLFVAQITDDNGNVVQLSSAALGFLAGYNTEFLFQAIERVAQAILPKVGLESVRRAKAPSVTITGETVTDLVAQAREEQDPKTKEAILALIERLKDKM